MNVVYNHADYRLLSRRAIEALRGYQETNLFLRGLVMHLGFKTAIVTYTRAALNCEIEISSPKMIALALEGVTAFSTMPLRYITLLGFPASFFSFLLGLWAFVSPCFFQKRRSRLGLDRHPHLLALRRADDLPWGHGRVYRQDIS